jgi:thioesterase domain-containing protein/acyl carrier protein
MVPSAVVFLPALPLTPNGKVNRMALPAPEANRSELAGAYVAPQDLLEQQLAQIWEKVFGREPIGGRDNFFELGGHSLMAVRMFAQIKKLTGKDLPLVTLFQAPTIEKLAEILRQQGWESPWASLVPIKPGGSKPPFYCVHGVGGNILEYLDLAKYFEEDQPFYGLQAIGLDGKRPIENLSVEQMATRYLEEVRAFQPRGPYYLGGSSFGGLVAYEMAQQLRAAGGEVGLLAFFDTNGPGYPKLLPTTTAWKRKLDWWRDRFALHWGNLRASSGGEKVAYAREKARRFKKQMRWKRQHLWDQIRERVGSIFWPEAIKQVRVIGYRAGTTYAPKPYAGRATLFRATEQPRGIYEDRTLGWLALVQGGLDIYDTPGHHGAIVREPRSRRLAEQLKDALEKAQANSSVAGTK